MSLLSRRGSKSPPSIYALCKPNVECCAQNKALEWLVVDGKAQVNHVMWRQTRRQSRSSV